MKWLLLAALAGAVMGFAPDYDGVGTAIAPDSTVALGTQIFVTGALVPGDVVRYEYYMDNVLKITHRTVVLTDKVPDMVAPAYGKTVVYKGCAQVERAGGVKVPATAGCWTQSFTRALPPLQVDSVRQLIVAMVPPVVLSGGTSQACVFAVMSSGRRLPPRRERVEAA